MIFCHLVGFTHTNNEFFNIHRSYSFWACMSKSPCVFKALYMSISLCDLHDNRQSVNVQKWRKDNKKYSQWPVLDCSCWARVIYAYPAIHRLYVLAHTFRKVEGDGLSFWEMRKQTKDTFLLKDLSSERADIFAQSPPICKQKQPLHSKRCSPHP